MKGYTVTIHEMAEFVSLVGTVPTILLAVCVVYWYGPIAWHGVRAIKRTREHWLIMGITIGFIGSILDNAYWAIPWTLSYYDHPLTQTAIMNGVFFNVIFRQGCGAVAAYCHLRGAVESRNDLKMVGLNTFMVVVNVLSAVAAVVLFWTKG